MENEIIAKLNCNIKGNYNNGTLIKLTQSSKNYSDTENLYQKDSDQEKFNNNIIFPQIINNSKKTSNKFNYEINDREKENSTFQETKSIELIEKSGIYNTVKSERSIKNINNHSSYYGNSTNKSKKHFNLYTNSNRGYNLAMSNDLNPMGNTFITFPNQRYKKNNNLAHHQIKNSPIISKVFESNKNEEMLIKKIHEDKINTTDNNKTSDNNNSNENASFTASDKRELEKVIIKEKKNSNNPMMSKQFYQISSFENKLNSELSRISRNYGKIEARRKFNNDLLEKYIDVIPNYDKYRIVKILNNKENYKFKLLPIIINKKNAFEKLGVKFFDNLKYNDPEYYDINKEWEEYLTKVKDSKIEEENQLNSINFDFSKDYKNIYQEEQSNLENNKLNINLSQEGLSTNKFFDSRNLDINKDKNLDLNKISIEKYNENEEEYKLA